MLNLYSGTPGSGKSLHVAKLIYTWITLYKSNVIACNLPINRTFLYRDDFKYRIYSILKFFHINVKFKTSIPRKKRGVLYTINDMDHFTPEFFYRYAAKFHKKGKEHQTLIVLDEAQNEFNPTVVKERNQMYKELRQKGIEIPYEDTYRNDWIKFFTHHRHLGYDIVFTSQFDKLIDSQIRCLFEYNFVHRKINNYSLGVFLSFFGLSAFLCVQHWYGAKLRCGSNIFMFRMKYARLYDSYSLYSKILQKYKDKYAEDKALVSAEA